MAVIRDAGKTDFVRNVLTKNNDANADDVNRAWKEAGREGSISDSLVQKTRAAMKLTKGRWPARKPGSGSAGAKGKSVVKKSAGRPAASADGMHQPATPAAPRGRLGSADRARALQELETGVDRLIFQSTGVGGLEEFEDVLRRARRVLVRTHEH